MSAMDELARGLPGDVLVTDPDIMKSYRRDRADLVTAGTPVAVARPVATEQVSQIMRWAWRHRVTVIPRGAGTGLSGGANAIDGSIVVCLERMTALREIDPVDQVAVVEAGVINADLERAARRHGMFYPPDPGSFEISTIGGNVATNAGGMRCVKYGVTRDSVLGFEVVLGDGRVLRTGARLAEIGQIARDAQIRIATVGHAGDGNLHPVLIFDGFDQRTRDRALAVAESICRAALACGGTVTGEHGVGMLKRGWLAAQLDDTALDVHHRIKAALDPRGLLNPGRAW
jgi:FAD/FMN-containing dehydrogenase